jgi:RNA polymerase sigma factor (sigma-70 family)
MNDAELRQCFSQIRRGDRGAFEALYADLQTPVFTVLLRIVQEQAEAEDLLQDFFIKLYQDPPGDRVAKPRAYLFQSARNLALDSLRKRRPALDIDQYPPPMAETDPAERLDLERALQTLTDLERQIVALHLNGGLTFRQTAEIVQAPLGSVLWKYRRALDKLRAQLAD